MVERISSCFLSMTKPRRTKKFFRIGGVATSRYKEADDLFVSFHEKGQNQWKA